MTDGINHEIETAVSTERLSTYRAAATSDSHAWALYRWNSELVSALAPLTIDLEVTLRNTIHQQLTTLYGRPDWWASNDLIIDDDTNSALTATLTRHRKATFKGTLSPNLIISELSFGVWGHAARSRRRFRTRPGR